MKAPGRSTAMILAPSAANNAALACPMPDAAPVTIAVLPSSLWGMKLSFVTHPETTAAESKKADPCGPAFRLIGRTEFGAACQGAGGADGI